MEKKLYITPIFLLVTLFINAQTNIFPSSGNVGIGTTSPTTKLEVEGKALVNSLSIDSKNSIASVNGFSNRIEFVNNTNGAIVFHPGLVDELMFGMHSNGNFYWGTGGNTSIKPNYYAMCLDADIGDLGIKGKLTSSEVKVQIGGWSDFVFAKDYELPTLKEVEQHIKDKGHLKDIPSAKEVEENGILLGDMNAKLLQKIEELTLYTIEQSKELEEKDVEIRELEKRISSQETLVNKIIETIKIKK